MKAILDIYGFTRMVELPHFISDIDIPITPGLSTAQMILESAPEIPSIKRWRFVFKKWLHNDEIALYYFDKEVS